MNAEPEIGVWPLAKGQELYHFLTLPLIISMLKTLLGTKFFSIKCLVDMYVHIPLAVTISHVQTVSTRPLLEGEGGLGTRLLANMHLVFNYMHFELIWLILLEGMLSPPKQP